MAVDGTACKTEVLPAAVQKRYAALPHLRLPLIGDGGLIRNGLTANAVGSKVAHAGHGHHALRRLLADGLLLRLKSCNTAQPPQLSPQVSLRILAAMLLFMVQLAGVPLLHAHAGAQQREAGQEGAGVVEGAHVLIAVKAPMRLFYLRPLRPARGAPRRGCPRAGPGTGRPSCGSQIRRPVRAGQQPQPGGVAHARAVSRCCAAGEHPLQMVAAGLLSCLCAGLTYPSAIGGANVCKGRLLC